MRLELVEKILAEITSTEFKAKHTVTQSVLSENGEPFLHPQILNILRMFKAAEMPVMLFSNFSRLVGDLAEKIIREDLIHCIHVNIDGATPETYHAAKGLPLGPVAYNLVNFLTIRNAMSSHIRVFMHVITHRTYSQAVLQAYNRVPVKFQGIYNQDEAQVIKRWTESINPDLDNIGADGVFFWPERYAGGSMRAGIFNCPNIDRIKHVAYINPAGDWYACCFDMGNELIMGNVHEQSIQEISVSERRLELIDNLEMRRFERVGFPCTRVDACQGMGRNEIDC